MSCCLKLLQLLLIFFTYLQAELTKLSVSEVLFGFTLNEPGQSELHSQHIPQIMGWWDGGRRLALSLVSSQGSRGVHCSTNMDYWLISADSWVTAVTLRINSSRVSDINSSADFDCSGLKHFCRLLAALKWSCVTRCFARAKNQFRTQRRPFENCLRKLQSIKIAQRRVARALLTLLLWQFPHCWI